MVNWWKTITTDYPWVVIGVAGALLVGAGWFGLGLFDEIKTSDQFTANNTESARAKQVIEQKFGTTPSTDVILFERKDAALGPADSDAYKAEVANILQPLLQSVNSVKSYVTQPSDAFISKDKTMTYAVIEGKGTEKEIYQTLTKFRDSADQSKLAVLIGGASVVSQQMNETVSRDLARTEMITLPILLVFLALFFGSIVAGLVPLGISFVTIAGAFAIARVVNHFVAVDHYAVNVVTILGIGLAIDYALLSVNRFREELHAHGNVKCAVRTVIDTSGRTVFFSAVTVIACMLSLLAFPMDFLHSIAIGSSSAVLVAMLFTILVLPAILMVLGKNINAWHLPFIKKHTGESRLWSRVAGLTTKHPVVAALAALAIIAVAVVPISQFKLAGGMDYRYVASGTSGRYVMESLQHDFAVQSPTITGVVTVSADVPAEARMRLSCDITNKIQQLPHVKDVVSPTHLAPDFTCDTFTALQQQGRLPAQLAALYTQNAKDNAMKFSVVLDAENGTKPADDTLLAIRGIKPAQGEWLVGGTEAYAYDTNTAYIGAIPVAVLIIGVSMMVLLALLLASVVIPLQAIIINGISLAISFAALVAIFQLGWIDALTKWGTVDGIVMTPLILIAAIAFGLAMDYSVFLYSRMFEVHQKTANPVQAIRQGIIKTGPIISAAAIMVFAVVIAFAGSSVTFMRMIGIGLGVAVLVDAFFVRLLLVPSVMTLLGRVSWYAPKWLKRLQIRHE